jgi:hypothetical protein
MGQPDAGELSGNNFTLSGGFWQEDAVITGPAYIIYLPVMARS